MPIWATIAVFALTWFLLYRTKFGRYVFAIGGNRRALILSGTRVNAYHIAVYVYAGLLAGIASFIMTARMNAAHPTIGVGLEFDAIAAVILGGTSFEKGRGGIVGTVIGALAVGVLRNGLNLLGVGTEWQVAIVGIVIIFAVGLDSTAEAERMSVETAKFPSRWTSLDSDQLFVVVSRLIALALLVVALSFLSPHFLTWPNLINVLRQASLQFMMSAGLTIVVLTAGIDLSVGAILGLSACISASLISSGYVVLGIGSALLAGTACGVVNGVIVTIARIPPFIATYGMLWIAFGLGYVFMKGEVIYGLPDGFRFIGAGFVGFLPVPVIVAALLLVVLHFVLHKTVLGRSIYAIGGNPDAARLSGMPVTRRLITVYGLSGFLAGFAALVVIARVNAADFQPWRGPLVAGDRGGLPRRHVVVWRRRRHHRHRRGLAHPRAHRQRDEFAWGADVLAKRRDGCDHSDFGAGRSTWRNAAGAPAVRLIRRASPPQRTARREHADRKKTLSWKQSRKRQWIAEHS